MSWHYEVVTFLFDYAYTSLEWNLKVLCKFFFFFKIIFKLKAFLVTLYVYNENEYLTSIKTVLDKTGCTVDYLFIIVGIRK